MIDNMKRRYKSNKKHHKLNISTEFIILIFLIGQFICLTSTEHDVGSKRVIKRDWRNSTKAPMAESAKSLYKRADVNFQESDSPIPWNNTPNLFKEYVKDNKMSIVQNEKLLNQLASPPPAQVGSETRRRSKREGETATDAAENSSSKESSAAKEDGSAPIGDPSDTTTATEQSSAQKEDGSATIGDPTDTTTMHPVTGDKGNKSDLIDCKDGLILAAWQPLEDVTLLERIIRGLIYYLAMCYIFIGISIASTRFMESIEVITSTEKRVNVISKEGNKETISIRVWNETVANLTLMALGSSAPEIFIAIIEMFQKNFTAGDLGPGTIIGSAAYNLFVIIAVCTIAIPKGQVRRIKAYRVFIVTATWSMFAYIWLCLITKFITPNIIDIWEGLLTVLFFPIFVYHAYITDRRLFCPGLYRTVSAQKSTNQRGDAVNTFENDENMPIRTSYRNLADTPEMKEFEESRRVYIAKVKELRQRYPHFDLTKIETMAQQHLIEKSNKSRAFYHIQSGRRITGGPNLMKKVEDYAANEIGETLALVRQQEEDDDEDDSDDYDTRICFAPSYYTVIEGAGHVDVHVIRSGYLTDLTKVEYYTEDGTAEAGSDYVSVRGILEFPPGIDEQIIRITIIDDELIEDDEHFYIFLRNPTDGAEIVKPKVAMIMILDDDHCGIFGFTEKEHHISESVEFHEFKVKRYAGAKGKVIVPYFTADNTAISGKDYQEVNGQLEFKNGEVEKTITVKIFQDNSYEKDVFFELYLGPPSLADDDPLKAKIATVQRKPEEQRNESERSLISGLPILAKLSMTKCHIFESLEFRQIVNKLVQTANASKLIGTTTWKEQFMNALKVSGEFNDGSDDDDDDDDISNNSYESRLVTDNYEGPKEWEYCSHFISVFWKIFFAVIPPAKKCNGYPCFFTSMFMIGILTAILGDLATHFGCTLGVLDSVTAICFVALGTSLPDTFASRIAAVQDKTADNAIGNVTGSNSVNVFLGIGIAWSMAAIYHACKGGEFAVPSGPILFSTVLFVVEAIMAFLVLAYLRHRGGELGGPEGLKYAQFIFFIFLWFIYITFSTLEAYNIIPGF